MKKHCYKFLFCCMVSTNIFGQNTIIPLWAGDAPNYQATEETEIHTNEDILWIEKVQTPTLQIFLPTKQNATGQAVVICPGGGYAGLAYDWEGTDFAKLLNAKGIAAFVLKYRLPNSKSISVPHETPFLDVQRAMRTVRFHAEKWNIQKDRIGILGFSAGGHLASTMGTHFENENLSSKDSIDQVSDRPDFMALAYPVISMSEKVTHQGSKDNLLGENLTEILVQKYSNELQVRADTPPTFLVHATDDTVVPVENALLFYQACKEKNIPVELHIYPKGGHGFSLAIGQGYLSSWVNRLTDWMESQ